MPVPSPLLIINGVSITTSDISSYKLTYNKLWKNANRDMSGDMSATLIGLYPNISIDTKPLDFDDAMALSAAVNQDYFTVSYWDTQTSSMKSAVYYAADHEVSVLTECIYASVKIELVAKHKANYI